MYSTYTVHKIENGEIHLKLNYNWFVFFLCWFNFFVVVAVVVSIVCYNTLSVVNSHLATLERFNSNNRGKSNRINCKSIAVTHSHCTLYRHNLVFFHFFLLMLAIWFRKGTDGKKAAENNGNVLSSLFFFFVCVCHVKMDLLSIRFNARTNFGFDVVYFRFI